MNVVEYAIQFRDYASGPLGRLTAQMQESIRLSRQMGRTGREASAGIAQGLNIASVLKGGAVAGAVVKAGRAAGELFGSSMREALDRQQIQTSFNVLAGSEAAGKKLTDQLVALQRDTILGGEVFQNAQTMMGFGFDADEVLGNLKMLGNVSMGNAEKLRALTLAYSQIRAAGKLTGQDLLQLVNAGFNPLEQMAKRTGKSVGELKDEMSEGKVSFADVQQAFIDATSEGGRFENMLARIAGQPVGKVQQLKGMWGEVKVAIGNAFMPLLEVGVNIGQRLMPVLEALTVPLSEGLQKALSYVQGLVGTTDSWRGMFDSVLSVVQPVWEVMDAVRGLVFDMLGDLVQFIKSSTLLRDIFVTIGFVIQKILNVVKWLIGQIRALWDELIMPILNAIEKVWRWINGYDTPTSNPVQTAPEQKKQTDKTNDLLANIALNTKANTRTSATTESTIRSGGPKVVNVQVGKFFDSLNFTTNNLTESVRDIERVVLEALSRVTVQGAASAVG